MSDLTGTARLYYTQRRVLNRLAPGDGTTETQLAVALNCTRAIIVVALARLQAQHLAVQYHDGWRITDAGIMAAMRAEARP